MTQSEKQKLLPCPWCKVQPAFGLGKKTGCQLHGDPIQRVTLGCNNPKCEVRPMVTGGDRYSNGETGDFFKRGEAAARELAAKHWNGNRAITDERRDWRPVKGWESFYEVNSSGIVRKITGEIIGQWKNDQGYLLVRLSNPRITVRVHKLVCEAFIPNPDNLPFVNHKDNNTSNPHYSNLEWCTQQENLAHARKQGRMYSHPKGKRSITAKLSEESAMQIRKEYSISDTSYQKLAVKYGSSKRTVMRIINGDSYV